MKDIPILNEDLVRKVADHIRDDPQSYEQGWYWHNYALEAACGSNGCIAGWALFLGDKAAWHRCYHDSVDAWDAEGARVLGIDFETAQYLFWGAARPADGLTVPEALEKWAAGSPLKEVWKHPGMDDE